MLTKPFNESTLCSTLISPDKKRTYLSYKTGFLIDAQNSNIIYISPKNAGSGHKMTLESFIYEYKDSKNRNWQKNILIELLSKKYNIDDKNYEELYRQLMNKNYPEQIKDVKLKNGQIILAKDIIKAYKQIENTIIKNQSFNNEIRLYNPKIKGLIIKDNFLDKVSEKVLEFVRKNNLPIFIMGE